MSIRDFLIKHAAPSITLTLWCMALVTFATWQVFTQPERVSPELAACYASLLAIPPAVIAFIQKRLGND